MSAPHPENAPEYCCPTRAKFVIGIVAERPGPVPIEAADFMDFDRKDFRGRPVLRIRYCPWCAKEVKGPLRVAGDPT